MTRKSTLGTIALAMLLAVFALVPEQSSAQIAFRAASSTSIQSLAPSPFWVAAGAGAGNTGTVSPAWPAHSPNDIGLLICESANENITLTTANGFTQIGAGLGTGTAGAAGATRMHAWWARATSNAMAAPLVADPGNHVYCQIHVYRGVVTTGNPYDAVSGGVKATASTSVTVTGVTTTVANALVVHVVTHDLDNAGAQFSAQANANFTVTERVDAGTTQGNGGGIAVWDGVMVTAGATGNTTATVTSSVNVFGMISLVPATPTPTLRGIGTGAGAAGTVSPAWPTPHAVNDIGLLFCESANQNITLTTANGFVEITGSGLPAGTGTAGAAGATRLHVFWARATSTAMAAPLVADPGNHVYCQIAVYSGVITSGNPWESFIAGTKGTASTAISVTGVTTTTANALIVHGVAHDRDDAAAQFSAITNGNLSTLSERADGGSTAGNGGGLAIWDGIMATGGATGNTTATIANSVVNAFATIALLPATPRINVPTGTLTGDVMVASIVLRPSSTLILPPAGWTAQTATTQGTGNTSRQQIFWRVATAADAAGGVSYQWALADASTGAAGAIVSYSAVDITSASPINVIGGNTTPQGADTNLQHRALSVTTTVPNTMVISTHSFASSELFTPPAGMTERVEDQSETVSNTAGVSLEMTDVIQPSAGATGDKLATVTSGLNGDTGTAQLLALRPAYTHYSVSYPNGASYATCEPAVVRIEGHHAGHGLAAPPAGTVMNIVTSTGTGVWQTPTVTGTGTWSPSGANNGVATYTWPGNEAVLEVRLRHNTATTLNLNLTETPAGKTEGTGTEDPTLTFATTVLRVSDSAGAAASIATQIAAKASDSNGLGTGTPVYYVQGVATATNNTCQTLFRNQTISVDFAMQCNSPTNCATTVDTFDVKNSGGTFTSIQKSSAAPGTYTAVTLAFDNTADAKAPLVFRYNDAGQTTLHMRYTLPSPPAGSTITGTSNAFVTRPFGFAFRGATSGTTVTHGVDHTSTVLAAAGDVFTMTVVAYKWVSAEDDGTGNPLAAANITDNGITPSFTGAVTVAPSVNLPGIQLGSVSRGVGCASAATIAASEFLSAGVPTGVATVSDWCYSEAGNVLLTATASNYITAGVSVTGNSGLDDTNGTNGHVGRFKPKQFAVSGGTLTNRAALACSPASTFSYMSERLDLAFTLTAQNTQGATTKNYHGAYAKLGLTTPANFNLGARSGATVFNNAAVTPTNRVSATASSGTWGNGVAGQEGTAAVTIQSGILRRTSGTVLDGAFTAVNFGIAPTDSDSVAMNTLDLDTNTTAGNDTKNLGVTTEVRFGRLRQQNAVASSGALVLPVPIELQYWDSAASVFRINSLDACTTISTGSVTLTPSLTGGSTSVLTIPITNASGFIRLAAPGAANTGFVLVTPALPTYLQGNWTGSTWDQNPSNRASWGVFGSAPQNFIYQRENY